jgi:hypothetical protein
MQCRLSLQYQSHESGSLRLPSRDALIRAFTSRRMEFGTRIVVLTDELRYFLFEAFWDAVLFPFFCDSMAVAVTALLLRAADEIAV